MHHRMGVVAMMLAATGCRSEPGVAPRGRIAFEKLCAACHQPEGLGTDSGGPPLAGSAWVRGPESRLVRIILHGVRGRIDVGGQTYDREMLGFGRVLTDEQIASLLTYVRATWGEPSPPVTPETVRQVRAETRDRGEYWTVTELLEIP